MTHNRERIQSSALRLGQIIVSRLALTLFAGLVVLSALTACSTAPDHPPVKTAAASIKAEPATAGSHYTLGSGDDIKLTVFGQPDLSGEFNVGGDGTVALPLLGPVKAEGKTIQEFQDEVSQLYVKNQILNQPQVSVEVLNYRPYYIIGEVNKSGEYPYQSGLSVLDAIAVAGGYTYRANQGHVFITHKGRKKAVRYPANASTMIKPGDVIRVPERYF